MRVLSLFDGIATGRLALEMAGVPVDLYIASEIDKDAKAVARANWPDMIHIGPVENVTAPDLPKIDLVIGGSPCQGFSRAGAGLNFDDPRSRLFFDYVRVLNEVREKNPDVKFLLENVIMKREWEDVITEKLGVQPVHINSRLKGPRGDCMCKHPDAVKTFNKVCPRSPRMAAFIGYTPPGETKPALKTSPTWCPMRPENKEEET